ncbi:MAG TPA: ATP synthase F0 subunit B [Candidatus Sulfotelmatobacter sp.]|nr:ATP synthase F0 subunit B [Candidatus Sulfotelmatobacter sp.]
MMNAGKFVRVGLLALMVSALGGASISAWAQAKSQPEQRTPESQSAQPHQGLGAQLAHGTREEAGEEKSEKAQFQESPSVQWLAEHTGLSVQHAALFSTLLNFAVIAAVFLWAAVKFLPGLFRNRTDAIQKAMQEAQKASAEARRRLSEIESRLAKLDVEIGMMRDAAEKDAAEEESRIHAAAEGDARKIVESAEQEISAAAKAAQRSLTAFAADLAVGLAQKQIHVDAGTDQALVRSFAANLGSTSETAGRDGR